MKHGTINLLRMLLFLSTLNVAHAAELVSIRVGILAAGEFSQTYIAQKKGFFARNGLDVELIYFQGGAQVERNSGVGFYHAEYRPCQKGRFFAHGRRLQVGA